MADADLSGSVLDGRYKVIEPIAEGAMGSVYRAERVGLGRAVAIKVMHQELPDELASRQRFEREAKLMALLEHPNCVSVMDFGLHDDKPYLVMDFVRGTSLLDVMDKSGALEVAKAGDIIRQVLSGLAHAHEHGIVHRDIKPANIMITEKSGLGQQVRILDFGLARMSESSTKLTTGIVVGTPNYMAPEQCKGSDIDARTDVYACGVMLFEMLTGRKPFVADDPIAVVRKHLLEPPPTLASVEPNVDWGDLEAVVAKALAKAPADRFASAVDMSKAVEVAAAKQTRTSAAALFARAVPDGAASVGAVQATMSGWNVPAGAQSSVLPTSDSGAAPAASQGASQGPTSGVANVHDASGPFTGVARVDESGGARGPMPGAGASSAGGSPASSGSDVSVALAAAWGGSESDVDTRAPTLAPSSLPPLPTAGPYVPPPRAGSAGGAVARPGSLGDGAASRDNGAGTAAVGNAASAASNGTPDAAIVVPPTRPSSQPAYVAPTVRPSGGASDRPIPQLPFTKKQLMIGAGGLLGLIVLIAIVAGGGDKKSGDKPKAGAGSTAVATPDKPADPASTSAERAKALIASEDYEQAVTLLKTARDDHPDSAELAFLAGKAYFSQLWWDDGIESFRDAIKLDPAYKENPELLKIVLKGFLTTPDIDDRIVSFMRRDIGPPMRPYLEETAQKHPKKPLRARAQAELNAR